MPDSDSDYYGRAGRRRYDLCGDGKPEQAAIAEGSIPDGLPEFFWQEKKNIIHTGGSECKEQQRMSVEVAAKSSGNYTFRLVRVRFYGLLGIGYLTRYVRYEERLSIMPKITPVMIEVGLLPGIFREKRKYMMIKPEDMMYRRYFRSVPFNREIKFQNIHWKLSAKEDELMVRENSLPWADRW